MAKPGGGSVSMAEYLKRYASGPAADGAGAGAGGGPAGKKRKKRPAAAVAGGGIRIVDEDATGFRPHVEAAARSDRYADEEDDDAAEEAAPTVVEDEVAKRREAMRARLAAEGAGWVTLAGDDADDAAAEAEEAAAGAKGRGGGGAAMRRQAAPAADLSPPRRRRHDSPDLSPPRRVKREEPADLSPPRRGGGPPAGGRDLSPPRRAAKREQGEEEAADLSPPRRGAQRHDSPLARGGGADLSPPRRRPAAAPAAVRPPAGDLSPPWRGGRRDSPSPPPRRGRHDSPDLSPPRRRARHDSPAGDLSPPRRGRRHDSPSPPPRRARHDSPDGRNQSPPRRGAGGAGGSAPAPPPGGGGPTRMSDGTVAGLRQASEITAELAAKRAAEAARFASLDAAATGRGAGTVYRERGSGKVIEGGREELLRQQAEKKAKDEADKAAQRPEWGAGLAQMRAAQEAAARQADAAARPFARTLEDVDRDSGLKDRLRWGDPMAHLVKRKEITDLPPVAAPDPDLLERGGFVVPQEVPPHSWLRRGLGPPGNRYNIRPGRHWDGVDRSTGFEKELFKAQAEKAWLKTEAYKWSSEDM